MKEKKTVIFNLDGTIFNVDHRTYLIKTKPPNWKAFNKACVDDPVYGSVVQLVRVMHEQTYQILLFTGREETVRSETIESLDINDIPFHHLVMRKEKDYRPDQIIKKEMLLKAANPLVRDDILFVVEDRDVVVKMWRDLGYTCLQPAYGDF